MTTTTHYGLLPCLVRERLTKVALELQLSLNDVINVILWDVLEYYTLEGCQKLDYTWELFKLTNKYNSVLHAGKLYGSETVNITLPDQLDNRVEEIVLQLQATDLNIFKPVATSLFLKVMIFPYTTHLLNKLCHKLMIEFPDRATKHSHTIYHFSEAKEFVDWIKHLSKTKISEYVENIDYSLPFFEYIKNTNPVILENDHSSWKLIELFNLSPQLPDPFNYQKIFNSINPVLVEEEEHLSHLILLNIVKSNFLNTLRILI
jgi:hypothetical protein